MKLQILLSCMHLNSVSEVKNLLNRSNIHSSCIVVSQCEKDEIYIEPNLKILFTTERGLSRSRNMAIANADDDAICLLCDDDEILADDCEKTIVSGYKSFPFADIIAFDLNNHTEKKNLGPSGRLGFRRMLKISSVQITFRKKTITDLGIRFDEKIGSGTGNGAGEENKFMLDARRHKCKIYLVREVIGCLLPSSPSQWFEGYNEKHFTDDGWSNRYIYGPYLSIPFIVFYIVKHRKQFNMNVFKAFKYELKGWAEKR